MVWYLFVLEFYLYDDELLNENWQFLISAYILIKYTLLKTSNATLIILSIYSMKVSE